MLKKTKTKSHTFRECLIYEAAALVLVHPELNLGIRDHLLGELGAQIQREPCEVTKRLDIVKMKRIEAKVGENIPIAHVHHAAAIS